MKWSENRFLTVVAALLAGSSSIPVLGCVLNSMPLVVRVSTNSVENRSDIRRYKELCFLTHVGKELRLACCEVKRLLYSHTPGPNS